MGHQVTVEAALRNDRFRALSGRIRRRSGHSISEVRSNDRDRRPFCAGTKPGTGAVDFRKEKGLER